MNRVRIDIRLSMVSDMTQDQLDEMDIWDVIKLIQRYRHSVIFNAEIDE